MTASGWKDAIARLRVRHADRDAVPVFRILDGDPLHLEVSVQNARDTVTDERLPSLVVSTVTLTYWPGEVVAMRWLAAAWAGYVQHEALELVTVNGLRPLDPHADPKFDRGLRHGLPVELTPETLLRSFEAVMPADLALEMTR